jgi:hypothetical protein
MTKRVCARHGQIRIKDVLIYARHRTIHPTTVGWIRFAKRMGASERKRQDALPYDGGAST